MKDRWILSVLEQEHWKLQESSRFGWYCVRRRDHMVAGDSLHEIYSRIKSQEAKREPQKKLESQG